MVGRLDARREDARNRRKDQRRSALDAKRGTDPLPDPQPASRVTRGALRTQNAASKIQEWKTRRAITAREIEKAKPPFNPYVRVKHTGCSPYKRAAPWRPRATNPPGSSGAGSRPANLTGAPARGVAAAWNPAGVPAAPVMKMGAAAVQLPILPHLDHVKCPKITFRAPTEVRPIPLPAPPNRPKIPAKKAVAKENVKSASDPRPLRTVDAQSTRGQKAESGRLLKLRNAPAPQPSQVQKSNTLMKKPQSVPAAKAKPAAQPAKKATAAPAPRADQPGRNLRVTRAAGVAQQKPAAKPTAADSNKPPVKKARLQPSKPDIQHPIQNDEMPVLAKLKSTPSPQRVLRSSTRLRLRDKENQLPGETVDLPLVQRRITRKRTTVAPIDESVREQIKPADQPGPSGASSERVKGLRERSSKLATETDRLRSLADAWVATKQNLNDNLPQTAIDEIDAVTGQTYLLTSKKFVQYKGLIEGAYQNPKTTFDDLDGFWEMMYLQVEQLDGQYRKLEELKQRNWANNSPRPVRRPTKSSAKPPKRPAAKAGSRKSQAEKKKKEAAVASESGSAVQDPALQRPAREPVSPGLNMSVDEITASPIRSAHSSLRNTSASARRSQRSAEPPKLPASPIPPTSGSPMRLRFLTPTKT